MHVHGLGSAVHIWTQQALQSKHDEILLCCPCLTSQDTEEQARITGHVVTSLAQTDKRDVKKAAASRLKLKLIYRCHM